MPPTKNACPEESHSGLSTSNASFSIDGANIGYPGPFRGLVIGSISSVITLADASIEIDNARNRMNLRRSI